MSEQLIARLANAFKPVPLPAGSPFYVELKAVRADADVCQDLGRKITRSLPTDYTHQLYTGHRGGGKSTELLRLKKYLEQKNCFVVYFVFVICFIPVCVISCLFGFFFIFEAIKVYLI